MTEKQYTCFLEDNGYWIRNEFNFKIIATGLKLGVAQNLVNELNNLHEENQHIKQTIKTMMENERTHIGKSVLKQLWEAIQ